MLLLSLLVETGKLPGAGLTQADKTCIQLNFYLEILKGGTWVSRGGKSPPCLPPKYNPVWQGSFSYFCITIIIQSVDSISRDERDAPLTQYITNAGITRARYTITHFKHHHHVLRLISNRMSV